MRQCAMNATVVKGFESTAQFKKHMTFPIKVSLWPQRNNCFQPKGLHEKLRQMSTWLVHIQQTYQTGTAQQLHKTVVPDHEYCLNAANHCHFKFHFFISHSSVLPCASSVAIETSHRLMKLYGQWSAHAP